MNIADQQIIKAINDVTGIPTKILKETALILALLHAKLFNNCMETCITDELKTAVVTPLFKNKGSRNDVNNFRGISVLPPVNKILEIPIEKQKGHNIELNIILSSAQHSFSKIFFGISVKSFIALMISRSAIFENLKPDVFSFFYPFNNLNV